MPAAACCWWWERKDDLLHDRMPGLVIATGHGVELYLLLSLSSNVLHLLNYRDVPCVDFILALE